MALTAGTRLGVYEITRLGVYEITAPLGEGGMGQVWRATDTTLGRHVAIKILPDAFAADPERLARFEREAKTLASLNHSHIAAIHAVENSGGTLALVMELVEGEDLSQRIARGAIPLDEALPIAKQIAEALEAAHEQGIIHSDLKPANIKVRADGTVKLLDFGLAKLRAPGGPIALPGTQTAATATGTAEGTILGTLHYMAPEQVEGKEADARSDVWALGAMIYEMVTGDGSPSPMPRADCAWRWQTRPSRPSPPVWRTHVAGPGGPTTQSHSGLATAVCIAWRRPAEHPNL